MTRTFELQYFDRNPFVDIANAGPIKSPISDDAGNTFHFVGEAYVRQWETYARQWETYARPWETYGRTTVVTLEVFTPPEYSTFMMSDCGDRIYPPTEEEKRIAKEELKKEYPITAEEAWKILTEDDSEPRLIGSGWYGSFWGGKGIVFFSCGDGCCYDTWDSKEQFLEFKGDTRFKRDI